MSEFDALEDVKLRSVSLVEAVDRPLLRGNFFDLEAAGVVRGLRMVGQPQVGVAPLDRGLRHVLQAVRAIQFRRMGMQDAPEIGLRHQLGQPSVERKPNFLARLAQLRRDERQAQRRVDFFFRPLGNDAAFPR